MPSAVAQIREEQGIVNAQLRAAESELGTLIDKPDKSNEDAKRVEYLRGSIDANLKIADSQSARLRQEEKLEAESEKPDAAALRNDALKRFVVTGKGLDALTSEEVDLYRRDDSDGFAVNVLEIPAATPAGVIPVDTQPEVADTLAPYGGVMSVARTVPTRTGVTLNWPAHDDTAVPSNSGRLVATSPASRNVEATQQPFFDIDLISTTYTSDPYPVSKEFVRDSVIDIETYLRQEVIRKMMRGINRDLTVGTGTGMPEGAARREAVTQAIATSGGAANRRWSNTFANLLPQIYTLYRAPYNYTVSEGEGGRSMMGGVTAWMMNYLSFIQLAEELTTETQSLLHIADGNIVGALSEMLLGRRIVINQQMAAPGGNGQFAQNSVIALFGNFSSYIFRPVDDARIEVWTDSFYGAHNQVAVQSFMAADGRYVGGKTAAGTATAAVQSFVAGA